MDGCNDLQVEVALEVRNVTGFCCCYLVAKSGFNSVIPCTVACRVPLSMGFSRQEYWNGVPFPSPGKLLTIGYFWYTEKYTLKVGDMNEENLHGEQNGMEKLPQGNNGDGP